MPIYSPLVVANKFIDLSIGAKFRVDPMKLQKLVYIAHGWTLVKTSRPLIDENVEAWPYGPVVPTLYSNFKSYRSSDIDATAPVSKYVRGLDQAGDDLAAQVWDQYGSMTAIELSMMTHQQGYAWDLARKAAEPWDTRPVIPQSFIKDEFRRRLRMAR